MADTIATAKAVHVRDYYRTRLGRREHVREHWRSWPGQLSFDFMRLADAA
jgi:hypothetical protein